MSPSKFSAFHYRDFTLLWIGLFISNIGSQMQFAAVNWHIFLLTHSALALGIVGLARFIPVAIFSLIAGSIADAHNRKKILFITQTLLTILSFLLAVITLLHRITPLIVYAITALSAAAISFDTPPRQAIIPNLVPKKDLTSAMSLNVIMFQASMIIGPALSGFIIGIGGVGSIYFINAISFIAVIIALLYMKTSGEVYSDAKKVSLRAIGEGITFVMSKTIIWSTMLLDFFSTFFSSATSLLPIYAEKILHVGPIGFGFLYAAPSVGAVLAGYIMAHLGTVKHQGKILLMSVSLYAVATIVFGFSKIFWISFVSLFFVGFGDSVSTVIRNLIRQLTTPDRIRGRMTSINMIFFLGGPQLGEFESGVLASRIGAPLSVAVGGAGTLIVASIIALLIPPLRNYSHEA